MSSMVLKLIAVMTMLLDHVASSCFVPWGIANIRLESMDWLMNRMTVYWLARLIGRIAFPIYCFLIVEGVAHTRNWKKYAMRLGILALISEIPFDFGLHNLTVNLAKPNVWQQLIQNSDWQHQNVFFTLLLGMLAVQFLKSSQRAITCFQKKRQSEGQPLGRIVSLLWILRYVVWAMLTWVLAYIAEYVLCTDYGNGGVIMISIMGLMYEYWEDWLWMIPRQVIRVFFCALGLFVCCQVLNNSFEMYGMLALLPIALYNGKKGFSSKALQYGFYVFYPLHLIVVGVLEIFAWWR